MLMTTISGVTHIVMPAGYYALCNKWVAYPPQRKFVEAEITCEECKKELAYLKDKPETGAGSRLFWF